MSNTSMSESTSAMSLSSRGDASLPVFDVFSSHTLHLEISGEPVDGRLAQLEALSTHQRIAAANSQRCCRLARHAHPSGATPQ
jgi:hypothetical protein